MSGGDDDQDKSFDPTPQKLLDARKKGEIARSVDLQTAASYAGLTLAIVAAGSNAVIFLGDLLSAIIDQADIISGQVFDGSPKQQ